jgi:hypothetical protein
MKVDDSLSNAFGLAPMAPQSNEVITHDGEIITPPNQKVENDYDTARTNLRELLTTGKAALEHALEVAKSSEHPRAFEVVGNLMKQLADVNQQLMDIHQQKQKLDGPKEVSKKEVTNNNVIFTGSTADLNKLLKNMSKGE